MASTVLQLVSPIIRELGEDASDPGVVQQFVDWTKDAVEELYAESTDWRFLHGSQSFSTSAGVSAYTLGTLVAEVKAVVRSTNNASLPLTTPEELARRGLDIAESGTPTNYMITTYSSINGPTIRLWPVPSSSESITVYRTTDPAALAEASTLEIPGAMFTVLRNHIRASYYMNSDDPSKSDRYRQLYAIGVRNARQKFAFSRDRRLVFQVRDIPRTGGSFRDAQLPGDYPRI